MMRLECNPPVNGTKLFVFNFTTRADLTAVRDLVNDSMRRAGSDSRTTSPVPPSSKAKRAAAPEDAGFVQPTPKRKKVSAAKSITDKQQIASARAQLLASNTELKAHHNELVVGGVVDEEDFWAQHQSAVADEKAKLKGAASKFLVANSLESTVPTKGIVKLTKEQMYHIFKMYPAVLEAYKDRVQTNEVAEREFWAQYFKSAYYHRDKASGQRSGVIVDDDFSRVEDQLRRREENNPRGVKKLAKNDFDLTQTLSVERPLGLRAGSGNQFPDRDGADNDDDLVDGASVGKRKVIEKYNKHGGIAVDSTDMAGSAANNTQHTDMVELTALASAPSGPAAYDEDKYAPVSISTSTKGAAPSSSSSSSPPPPSSAPLLTAPELLQHLDEENQRIHKTSFVSYDPFNAATTLFPDHKKANHILSRLSKSMSETTHSAKSSAALEQQLDREFKSNVETFYKQSQELLRHFFSFLKGSEPPDSVRLSKVVAKIKEKYEYASIEIKTLRAQGDPISLVKAKMLEPLTDQLSFAYEKAGQKSGWS